MVQVLLFYFEIMIFITVNGLGNGKDFSKVYYV